MPSPSIARFAVDIARKPSDTWGVPAEAPPLLPIFRSRPQGELLALILADDARRWTIAELAERTGQPYQTVTAEVRRLERAGLVSSSSVGRTKLLAANEASPYLGPLSQLATMAFGPPLVIAEEFATVGAIDTIYIYGSWAARYRGEPGPPPNDVDVLVIGRPDRDEVYDAARRAEQRLGRDVNVTQRTRKQWDTSTDGFSRQLRASPLVEVPYPEGHAAVEQGG